MRKLVFTSNIHCNNCLAKVTPVLNQEKQIKKWGVDLNSEDRILEVESETLSPDDVRNAVLRTGFIVEFVQEKNE